MKFIADAMLGKLAKRLRFLGIDVLYTPGADDNDVLRIALEDGRTVLTRDAGLASRPLADNCLLVRSVQADRQVDEVLSAFPSLRRQEPLTRCSVCNAPLRPAVRKDVRDLVPAHVLMSARAFLQCGGCGKVYWEGSHVKRMGLGKNKGKKPASR